MGNIDQSIEVRYLVKKYDNNCVLDIDYLKFEPSKVYGVMGANGSGKTTLMRIVAGIEKFDSGEVLSKGKIIQMLEHEVALFQELSIYENIFVNKHKYKTILGIKFMDWKTMKKDAQKLLDQHGLKISANKKVFQLERSVQKLLEIILLISSAADFVIIDEPFNYLDQNQTRYLKELIVSFKETGKTVICISHDMDEIIQIVDETIVIRNGKLVGCLTAEEAKKGIESTGNRYPKRKVSLGKTIFQTVGITNEQVSNISFELREGEILGIVGFKGSHKSYLGKVLFGAAHAKGDIYIDSKKLRIKSTYQVVKKGVCYIGSSSEGVFLDDTIMNNMTSANTKRSSVLDNQSKKIIAQYYMDMLNIKPLDIEERLSKLSSGNKQKVLLAKWFISNSRVFIFNRPTAHVDVSSKVDIYNIFMDLAESKKGLILISNDLDEIVGMCDTVLVLKNGEISKSLKAEDVTIENIMAYAK